jgi:hypothetical protein
VGVAGRLANHCTPSGSRHLPPSHCRHECCDPHSLKRSTGGCSGNGEVCGTNASLYRAGPGPWPGRPDLSRNRHSNGEKTAIFNEKSQEWSILGSRLLGILRYRASDDLGNLKQGAAPPTGGAAPRYRLTDLSGRHKNSQHDQSEPCVSQNQAGQCHPRPGQADADPPWRTRRSKDTLETQRSGK